jgi:5-methylcytosine-specific restriction endonuclease McrA
MSNLEVQHKEFRSHSGDDSEENLITLCTTCHSEAHNLTAKERISRQSGPDLASRQMD